MFALLESGALVALDGRTGRQAYNLTIYVYLSHRHSFSASPDFCVTPRPAGWWIENLHAIGWLGIRHTHTHTKSTVEYSPANPI